MANLGEHYRNFSRIDFDARGAYGRVSDVVDAKSQNNIHLAFKLMRHEIDYQKGWAQFKSEQELLVKFTTDINCPGAITKIIDSGFAPVDLSYALHELKDPDPSLPIYQTGKNIEDFVRTGDDLSEKESGKWLPYLVVELAPYDDSLLRQIHHQPKDENAEHYRLPAGEVIIMALQLLEVVNYLHQKYDRAYLDWKPEHIYWNGYTKKAKLIDWNVTCDLAESPGLDQNIRDDLRLFCGAVLYIGLTFIDPGDPSKPIGPRPTEEFSNPISEIRGRYWTDNPNFHQRDKTLDESIKCLVQKGLHPTQGFESSEALRAELVEYAKRVLGAVEDELLPGSVPQSQYFKALAAVREARNQYLLAQQSLIIAVETKGSNQEIDWLFNAAKRALVIMPGS